MPGWPENRHRCVCGWETSAWANMVGHRRQCDSWQEHKRGLGGHSDAPAADQPAEAFPYRCPVEGCDARGSKPEFVIQHFPTCSKLRDDVHVSEVERAEIDVDLNIVLAAAARRHEDQLAFERWCQENGRP